MAEDTRKYLAKHYDEKGNMIRERVIESKTRADARKHASNSSISIELLSVNDALRLSGIEVEVAGAPVDPDKGVDPDQQSLGIDNNFQHEARDQQSDGQ